MKCGSKVWYIPDAYWPEISNGVYPSHEAVCVLNQGDTDACIELTLFFEDRDKMTGFKAICKAGRTNHIRMDRLQNEVGQAVPRGVPYAVMVNSSTEIIAQYSRLDSTQAEMALMTTMAYPIFYDRRKIK